MRDDDCAVIAIGVEILQGHRNAGPTYLPHGCFKVENDSYIGLCSGSVLTAQRSDAEARKEKKRQPKGAWILHFGQVLRIQELQDKK